MSEEVAALDQGQGEPTLGGAVKEVAVLFSEARGRARSMPIRHRPRASPPRLFLLRLRGLASLVAPHARACRTRRRDSRRSEIYDDPPMLFDKNLVALLSGRSAWPVTWPPVG